MDDIKVIDNLLPTSYQDAIEQLVFSSEFDWHYVNDVTDVTHINNGTYKSMDGFSHVFHGQKNTSKYYDFIKPVLLHAASQLNLPFNLDQVWRARVGLMFQRRQDDPEYNNPHVDHVMPHWTGIYYVNDNDGPTYIFDQKVLDIPFTKRTDQGILDYLNTTPMTAAKIVEPKKGRFVIFNGSRFHSSSRPTLASKRAVITFNWKANHQATNGLSNGQLS